MKSGSVTDATIGVPVSQYDVPEGTLSPPSSKFRYWLFVLSQWRLASTLQLVASECYKFPLRIVAVLQKEHLPNDAWGLPYCRGCSPPIFYEECTYLCASTEDTQRLLRLYRWAGTLDHRIAIESFQLGVEFGRRNDCTRELNAPPSLEK